MNVLFSHRTTILYSRNYSFHTKVASDMAEDAPEETLAFIIKNCPSMSPELKKENLAFFLEALTPAFGSFWTICNISMSTGKDLKEKAKTDAIFRQQCIKESLRMYPPVPILWPRKALCDQEMANPLFGAPAIQRTWTESLFGGTPIEKQPTIKIKKGTTLILVRTIRDGKMVLHWLVLAVGIAVAVV
jgi:hypothetical protein